MERWRDIPGFPGYRIDVTSCVIVGKRGKPLTAGKDGAVSMWDEYKRYHRPVPERLAWSVVNAVPYASIPAKVSIRNLRGTLVQHERGPVARQRLQMARKALEDKRLGFVNK